MKKRICFFLIISLGALSIAPVFNAIAILNGSKPAPNRLSEWRGTFFNMDFAVSAVSAKLYHLGISTDPEKVVIGKDGWLFLGDSYAKSITRKRGYLPEEAQAAERTLSNSATTWNNWFRARGIKEYLILIGPDKDSIYSDKVPKWAHHSNPTLMGELMGKLDKRFFIYPAEKLSEARKKFNLPVYYTTDTHWNVLGGTVAFDAFNDVFAARHPEIIFPKSIEGNNFDAGERTGGDLANFLRIREVLKDTELKFKNHVYPTLSVEHFDFASGQKIYAGSNPDVAILTTPTIVYSKNALNDSRVLWLRDSFGSALAPMMTMTFRETLQLHHNRANPALLNDIVKKFKPEYVFVTHVERDVLSSFLTSFPELEPSHSREGFIASETGFSSELHHLVATAAGDTNEINGIDPFIVFSLPKAVAARDISGIAFDLTCQGAEKDIPIQMYWRNDKTTFMESKSIRFKASTGTNLLPLMANAPWMSTDAVSEVRLDLDDPTRCKAVAFNDVALGSIH